MDALTHQLSQFQNNKVDYSLTTNKISFAEIFADRSDNCYNEFNFYLALFNQIPNFSHITNINCKKAHKWFFENYTAEIKDVYYNQRCLRNKNKTELDDIFYILNEDLLVDFDTNQDIVRFLYRKTEISVIEKIESELGKFKIKKERNKPQISIIVQSKFGLNTKEMEIIKPKLKLNDNYNEDFLEIHQTIYQRLSKKNDKGLVLLHGKPGTGKTSYIRFLIASLKKKVIFLTPQMAESVTSPHLIELLIENPNSVFVIEDAENIIIDRNEQAHSPVSALLNITDGLLSDCLHVQIICSFNTDISKVDSALLRKGRLIAQYEFKELEIEKALALSLKLGFNTLIQKPMTLTEIYNQEEKSFESANQRKQIGFKVG